jgi:hypothetical protein
VPTLDTATITTTDTFQALAAPVGTTGLVLTVSNAAVMMGMVSGSWVDPVSGRVFPRDVAALTAWSADELLLPAIHYVDDEPIRGMRLRSRATGAPAIVDVTFLG